ncbi:hypothetical protein AX23_05480 [Brucella melitensis 548]|nr:hypothetical protein AX23_05480 [Brucella melitensis 548]
MGMELAHDIANDTGAFRISLIGIKPQEAHGVHDAAVHRL